jgi:hypothetical protein
MNKKGYIVLFFLCLSIVSLGVCNCVAAPSATLDNVIVYPNPFNSAEGHKRVVFYNVTDSVRLRVFALTGENIFDETINSQNGQIQWECTDKKNDKVSPGLYVYLLTNGAGQKKQGKLVVIR